ncbi:MAG TPA: GntR family transcriptional regulator [Roseiflexaceae bacterium]|nr:GntR family transcriptional regulator [Roseiflexaceae bacterium]
MSSVLWQAAAQFVQASDSLVAHAYETLWKQIVEGERQPGERLVDADLVAELGVSRTPIRHALYQLEQAGLVEASPRRGFHVVIFSVDDVRELYDLRIILETAAVRAAISRIPDADLLAALEEIKQLQQMPEPERSPLFLASDMLFHHQLLAGNSGNRRLAEAIAQQRARMSIFLAGGTRLPNANTTALIEHQAIAQALVARDEAGATAAMERHLQRVKEDALREFATVRRPRVRRLRPSPAE